MYRSARSDLRSGFTTGVAAAAAVKAAMCCLIAATAPQKVTIDLPTGASLDIDVHRCQQTDDTTAVCSVVKDAGDDPDITNGAEIGAKVQWRPGGSNRRVHVCGGEGVGRVTRPGLEVSPGHAAINPVPRKMIRDAACQVMAAGNVFGRAVAEIFVPRGEELARHTLNDRLGIVGGISILGTTGIVRPLSHDAYVATIKAAISVAWASGVQRVVMTTGRRSERFAQALWPDRPGTAFVQIGDYFSVALGMAADQRLAEVTLAVFFGKAVKMAMAIPHTHARSARLTLAQLGRWTAEITGREDLARKVADANTARAAFDLVGDDYPGLIAKVGDEVLKAAVRFAGNRLSVRAVIFDFEGRVRFDSGEDHTP